MNAKRFILAVLAVFIATFVTDYLIHGLWLEGAYTETIDLWRSDPEILLNFPWTMGSQLLAAILIVGVWAMAFTEGATLRRAVLFGLLVGLLRQASTLTTYAVQPVPSSLALKWFVSGMAQSLLLALLVFAIYRPRLAPSPEQQGASERRWAAAAVLVTLLIVGAWLLSPGQSSSPGEAAACLAPGASAGNAPPPDPASLATLLSPVDTSGGRGSAEAKAAFLEDLMRLDAQVRERNRLFEPELQPLLDTIVKRQLKGKNVAYSMQIFREIRWWLNFTSDTNTTRARIAHLKKSLEGGRSQRFAEEQLPDGSWGPGYTVWFMRLYGTVEGALSIGKKPKYPLSFLDRINSPEKLTNYLHSVVVSDFLKTGVLNRMEADEAASILGRLILGDEESGYPFHPQLKEAYLKFLDGWQNPETGCWGNWYVGRDGTWWRADDVGMTFHILALPDYEAKLLDKIARRVLQLSAFDFPMGIRMNGRYENHLNWDAVVIWRRAWPRLNAQTKAEVRAEISRMLNWSLTESLQPDGSFRLSELDNTFGDAMDFGVCFLRDTGFFRKADRFWTDEDFPQAKAVYERIKARLESAGRQAPELTRAYRRLTRIEPRFDTDSERL